MSGRRPTRPPAGETAGGTTARYRPALIDGVAGLALRRGQNAPVPPPPRPPGVAPSPGAPVPPRRSVGAAAAPDEPDRPPADSDSDTARRLTRARDALSGRGLSGEPDRATAGLAEWLAWHDRLLELPRDEDVRLALKIAEAQIARLRARMR